MALGILAGVAATGGVQAQEDGGNLLLRKLVQKGVLTEKEADELLAESRQEAKQQYTMWQKDNYVPSWVKKLSMNGDLRLRSDNISMNDDTGTANRMRWRYRLRYGVAATFNGEWMVGFRLASGGQDDAISTNQTLDDDGENDMLNIDQAYAKWTPNDSMTAIFGKMVNTFSFDKAIIDGDYTPEGIAFNYEQDLAENHSFGLGAAGWVIEEEEDATKDGYALVLQATLDSTLSSTMSSHLGVGTYTFINTDAGHTEDSKNGGNSATGQYNPIIIDGALTYKESSVPIKLGASYITNPAVDQDDSGYLLGITFNESKKPGSWELGYQYRRLEADSLWDNWTDSDFGAWGVGGIANSFKAGTDIRGHVIRGKYQVNSAMQAIATAFLSESMNNKSDDATRIVVDVIFKF